MGVFYNTTKTPRRVKDPGTDKTLSASGSLAYGGMTSTGGLAGGTGIDAKLVHGDRFQTIDHNIDTTIFQNETYLVGGNQKETVIGDCTEMIIGNDTLMVMGTTL